MPFIFRKPSNAHFRYPATIQDIDYSANRQLDKNTFERLALLSFVRSHENIIITGATGTGKSYLAQSLGNQACLMLMKTLYYNTARLMDHLKLARLEGNYIKQLMKIEKAELLILDDFGLSAFDNQARQTRWHNMTGISTPKNRQLTKERTTT